MKTFIKIIFLLMGLRLIFSTIFETPSLFVGFIGVVLTVLCAVSLYQEFAEWKNENKK